MKKRERPALAVAVILILLSISSYRKNGSPWAGGITTENGVVVIRNPAVPMFGKDACSIEEDLSISGSGNAGGPTFSEITDLAVDGDENVYILDWKEACCHVFDRTGRYLRTIGKKGQGPGEMQRPMSIFITQNNEIVVNDRGGRFLVFFGLDGQHQKSLSLAKMPFFSGPRVDSQGNIIARSARIEPLRVSLCLAKFDSELNKLFDIFYYEYKNSGGKIYDVYPPQCFWEVLGDDHIVWGYNAGYELQVLDPDGRVVRRIMKDHNPVKTTDDEKQDWIKFAFGDRGVPPDVKVNWPSHHNAFRSIHVDDSGRIFVGTYEKAADGLGDYYDIFDREGKYGARVVLKAEPKVVKKDQIYTIEEDQDGNQVVKRFKITWWVDTARSRRLKSAGRSSEKARK
jgi:hypothetical protein